MIEQKSVIFLPRKKMFNGQVSGEEDTVTMPTISLASYLSPLNRLKTTLRKYPRTWIKKLIQVSLIDNSNHNLVFNQNTI